MTLEELNIAWSVPMLIFGASMAAIGLLWLPIRYRRPKVPLLLLVGGLTVAAAPSAISRLFPIDLSEIEKVVNDERHLTLTGWNKKDYSLLKQKTDAVIVQMGNPDVTDDTLAFLADFKKLKILDLSDTKITDAGLARLTQLPVLDTLHLERTAVTDAGVVQHLKDHPTLRVIWLRATKVTPAAAEEIKAAKKGRRVVVDAPRTDDR